MTKYEKYLQTYSGKKLLKEYPLYESGYWLVQGEDANCDFLGSHHEPVLMLVEGELEHVIKLGVEHDRFFTWGGGGSFTKMEMHHAKGYI